MKGWTAALLVLWSLAPSAQPASTRVIRGRVVVDGTDEPVVNARIAAQSSALGSAVTLTDDEGRFTLDVAASDARLSVHKTGYGRLDVAVGNGAESIEIRLQRGASVSGTVVDEFGDSVQGARVAIYEAASATSPAIALGVTDDRGQYRLGSLQSGRYLIAATASGPMVTEVLNPNQIVRRPQIRTSFYPDTASREEAERLVLEAGEDRPRIDFVIDGAQSIGPTANVRQLGPLTRAPEPVSGPATGIIRGRVTSTDGRGLPHANVRIMLQRDARQTVVTRADDEARYEFRDLPPGTYGLIASKTGFGPVASDQPTTERGVPLLRSVRVEIAAGETKDRVDIPLSRLGSLSGRVVDERGDPFEGARVEVLQIRYEEGRRRLVPASQLSLTDDLGRYRLSGLAPGRYAVSAAAGDVLSVDIPGYARAYYPGTANPGQAQFITIDAAQDQIGIDLSLPRTRTARVSGTLINAAGVHGPGGSLTMSPSYSSPSAIDVPIGARIRDNGEFEFANVAPGQYVIRAEQGRRNASTEGEFGTLPVVVDGADVRGLRLQTSAGSSIHGRITFDARDPSARPPARALELAAAAVNFDLAPRSVASADIHDDWSFDLSGINGPRRLLLAAAPAGWTLEDVRVNGVSAIDRPLAFGRADQSLQNVEVVLTDRVSELAGRVHDGRGEPLPGVSVIVFSTDRDRWYHASRFIGMTAAGEGGAYSLTGMPFGAYYAAAIRRLPNEGDQAWRAPEFLAALIPGAATVTIRDGQKVSLDVQAFAAR
jgi:protocatechuate 3,4-dioxygenase beta subunit